MADTKPPWMHHQPSRSLYQLFTVGSIIVRVPAWIVTSLVPSLRPHNEWSAKQAFLVRLLRAVSVMIGQVGVSDTITLQPGKEGDRFQVFEPFAADLYKGPLVSDTVKPAKIGGTWYPHAPDSSTDFHSKTVFLHLHGGAFVMGDGRDAQCGVLSSILLQNAGADLIFNPQYRLAAYGHQNPFPAALQDCLTSYLYLVRTLNIPSHNIILTGDSAGANLAIGLLRYLAEFEPQLPRPKAAVLLSPWVAPLDSFAPDSVHESNANFHSDHLPPPFLRWGARAYLGGVAEADKNPYITPLGHPFTSSVPIWVSVGTAELLATDAVKWTEEMKTVKENRIEANLEDGAPHDTCLVGHYIGWDSSSQDVARKAGAFIKTV